MHKITKQTADKIIQMDDLKRLGNLMKQRVESTTTPNPISFLVAGQFCNSSSYDADSIDGLNDILYDIQKLSQLDIRSGKSFDDNCFVSMNNSSIRIQVQGNDRDWVNVTSRDIEGIISSWANQNYQGSFFYKFGWMRILAYIIPLEIINIFILLSLDKHFPSIYKSIQTWQSVSLIVLVWVIITYFDSRIPRFRSLWPSVEFAFGPIDSREITLRNNIKRLAPWIVGVITSVLIPIVLYLV